MNTPPKEHINVDHHKLHAFVSTAAQTVGLTAEKAELLAELLTKNHQYLFLLYENAGQFFYFV